MPDNSKYPGFDTIYRRAIDKGKTRTEAIRLACRAYVKHICDFEGIQVDERKAEKLATEGLKLYDEYRFDDRSHRDSMDAAKKHIGGGILDHYEENGPENRYAKTPRRPEGGLDNMADLFDSLPTREGKAKGHGSSRPKHGGSGSSSNYGGSGSPSRPHHGGSGSSSHYGGSGHSSRPHHGGSGHSSRPHHGSSSRPHHNGSSSHHHQPSNTSHNGFFPDGTPRPSWAKPLPSHLQRDINSDEEDELFGPDTKKKFGVKPPRGGFKTKEFRPTPGFDFASEFGGAAGRPSSSSSRRDSSPEGSDYFDSSRKKHAKALRHHQSMGGGGAGYGPSSFSSGYGGSPFSQSSNPKGGSGGPGGFNPQDFRPGGSHSQSGFGSGGGGGDMFSDFFGGGGNDPFSNFMGGGGSGSGPRGYNTQEFRPTPGFNFASEFGGGTGSSSHHSHGHNSHGPRRASTSSHLDLSDDDSPGGYSQHRQSHSSHPPPPSFDNGIHPPNCFYKVLDIPRTATDSEIKTAYRKMSLKYHPDRAAASGMERGRATRKMAEVNQANDVLGDRGKRGYYDATGCIKPAF